MKKLVILFLSMGLSLSCLAAPQRYIDAVRNSEAMQRVMQQAGGEIFIIDIIEVRSFKCPGCYEFEMRYYSANKADVQSTKFQTRDTNFDGRRILVFNR